MDGLRRWDKKVGQRMVQLGEIRRGEGRRRGDLRGLMWGREESSRGIKREKGKIGKEMGISFFLGNARITGRAALVHSYIHTW